MLPKIFQSSNKGLVTFSSMISCLSEVLSLDHGKIHSHKHGVQVGRSIDPCSLNKPGHPVST